LSGRLQGIEGETDCKEASSERSTINRAMRPSFGKATVMIIMEVGQEVRRASWDRTIPECIN